MPPGAISTKAHNNNRNAVAISCSLYSSLQPSCQFVKRVDCQKFLLTLESVLGVHHDRGVMGDAQACPGVP